MKKFIERLKVFMNTLIFSYNEYLPMILALLLWWFSGLLTRLVDPTAAVDDAGLFQAMLFGIVLYCASQACAWFSMRIAFPKIGKFLDDSVAVNFDGLTVRQRVYVAIALFAVHFVGAVIILANVV